MPSQSNKKSSKQELDVFGVKATGGESTESNTKPSKTKKSKPFPSELIAAL
jgi:hypothetical protein